jgi:large repetitive protein
MPGAKKVHVYDGATLKGSPTVDVGGNWSLSGVSLGTGSHDLIAKSEDLAGNISSQTIKRILVGETATPSIELLDDSGSSSSDKVTNDNTPRLRAVLTLTIPGGAAACSSNSVKEFKLYKYNTVTSAWDVAGTISSVSFDGLKKYDGTFQVTVALAEGAHKLAFTWVDQLNNESARGADISVTIDTTAPNAPVISSVSDGQVFVGTSVNISGTAS